MFRYKSIREQLAEEQQKNAKIQNELDKAYGDIIYISMMTDVDLDTEEEEETENVEEV